MTEAFYTALQAGSGGACLLVALWLAWTRRPGAALAPALLAAFFAAVLLGESRGLRAALFYPALLALLVGYARRGHHAR